MTNSAEFALNGETRSSARIDTNHKDDVEAAAGEPTDGMDGETNNTNHKGLSTQTFCSEDGQVAAPVVSEKDHSNASDDFGEFHEPVAKQDPSAASSMHNHITENGNKPDQEVAYAGQKNGELEGNGNNHHDAVPDDDFGDFAGSADGHQNVAGTEHYPNKNSDEVDEFGGFDSVSTGYQQAQTASSEQCGIETMNDLSTSADTTEGDAPDDGFRESRSDDSMPSNDDRKGDSAAEDDFGGFESATPDVEPTASDACKYGEKTDAIVSADGFGGFESATDSGEAAGESAAAPQSGTADASQPNGNQDMEDSFGEFDSAPVGLAEQTDSKQNDADLHDQSEVSVDERAGPDEIVDDKIPVDTAETRDELPNSVAQGEEHKSTDPDDDFGEFDAAPIQTAETTGETAARQQSSGTAVEQKPKDDDEFGDFGDFDSAPAVPRGQPQEKNEDDEFGDFGDFDSAPANPGAVPDAKPQETPTPQQPVEGETDDDFGDFGSAPTETAGATEDDDFGDFNEVDGGKSVAAAHTSCNQTAVVEHRRQLLRKLFAFTGRDVDEGEASSGDVQSFDASANALLSSTIERRRRSPSSSPGGNTTSLLQNSVAKGARPSAKKFVAAPHEYDYFSHAAFPEGGFLAPALNITGRIGHKSRSRQTSRDDNDGTVSRAEAYLPDVLDIRLPSANDRLVDMASPTSPGKQTVVLPDASSTKPSLPALGRKVSDKKGAAKPVAAKPTSQPSNHVQQLWNQIPDMSFMLTSKLSIPSNPS